MKTAQAILKTLFETPFHYEGKIVYVIDIMGYQVEIGPHPHKGESAWHSPKDLKIADVPVTLFDPLKEMLKEDFINYHTGFLDDEGGEGEVVAKGLKSLNKKEKEIFEKELAALIMENNLIDPKQFEDEETTDYFAREYERILKKIKG